MLSNLRKAVFFNLWETFSVLKKKLYGFCIKYFSQYIIDLLPDSGIN
jgi:hypothetical protein